MTNTNFVKSNPDNERKGDAPMMANFSKRTHLYRIAIAAAWVCCMVIMVFCTDSFCLYRSDHAFDHMSVMLNVDHVESVGDLDDTHYSVKASTNGVIEDLAVEKSEIKNQVEAISYRPINRSTLLFLALKILFVCVVLVVADMMADADPPRTRSSIKASLTIQHAQIAIFASTFIVQMAAIVINVIAALVSYDIYIPSFLEYVIVALVLSVAAYIFLARIDKICPDDLVVD